MKRFSFVVLAAALIAASYSSVSARSQVQHDGSQAQASAANPAWCSANHDVGKVGLAVGNDGTLANFAAAGRIYDCFTAEPILLGEYPLGNGTMYIFGGALWIGAVVGNDTLVSTGTDGWATSGNEFHPDFAENGGAMQYRSIIDPDQPTFDGALSEQDYIGVYRDTCRTCTGVSRDRVDNRGHIPLNLEVTQRSFSWSYPVAEDFVLLDFSIKNIGATPLEDVYIGLFIDNDIMDREDDSYMGATDDLVGMWSGSVNSSRGAACETSLEIEMPWAADNDGDLNASLVYKPVPHVMGTRLLNIAGSVPQVTFNWFFSNGDHTLDWGPMRRTNARDFGTGGSGTPEGDRNKYYLLSNEDRDFDVALAGTIGSLDSTWLPPPPVASLLGLGFDSRYLLSSGELALEPGQSVPMTVAVVCGENFHTIPDNMDNLPDDPAGYYAGLDFSDLLNNGLMAGWVYDNPGVDTDSDGYAGMYQLCGEDTLWYQGDGVPDFCAATPPSAPVARVTPLDDGFVVRWNGWRCETQVDWASRERRFEGYRVYLATGGAPGSFARLGSYDVEDYRRYYWDSEMNAWVCSAGRLTLEEARCHYAPGGCSDAAWHPLDFTRQAPFVVTGYPDSVLYFLPIMANSSRFGLETPFHKSFPDALRPSYADPSEVPSDSVAFYLTDEGYFKYFEYEMTVDGLIGGQTYRVAVTSFDYGSKVDGAEPQESAVAENSLSVMPTGPCCVGFVGNADCDDQDVVSIADVAAVVDRLFISRWPVCCPSEADVNQSGGVAPTTADVSLSDVLILIDYLFITGQSLDMPACR